MIYVDWTANRERSPVELGLSPRQQVVRLLQFDPVVILPVRPLEQHDDYLSLDTDCFLVTQIASADAVRVGWGKGSAVRVERKNRNHAMKQGKNT